MLLKDRTAIVTGAASKRGLGRATAQLFAEHGATVAILDIDEEQSRLAAAALPGKGHVGLACDVTDHNRCLAVVAVLVEKLGHIDALVNIAGIAQSLKLMEIKRLRAKGHKITLVDERQFWSLASRRRG